MQHGRLLSPLRRDLPQGEGRGFASAILALHPFPAVCHMINPTLSGKKGIFVFSLNGKTAFVTGASYGIGFAIANCA